jgi:hypothetical protein
MRTHQEASEKKSSAQNTFVPTPNPLASRPFAVQPKPEESERSHSTTKSANAMPDFAILNPEGGRAMPVQPKLTETSKQSAKNLAENGLIKGKGLNAPTMTVSSSNPSVPNLQMIKDFDEWKKDYQGEEGEALKAWLDQAIVEYKDLYAEIAGKPISKDTKKEEVPLAIKKIHENFVSSCQKLRDKKDDNQARTQLVTVLNNMALVVSKNRTSVGLPYLTTNKEIAQHVLCFLPLTSLIKVRATNKYLRYLADTTILFKTYLPNYKATLTVTLQDVTNSMKEKTFVGYHGSSS